MAFSVDNALSAVSLPLRERGLKSLVRSPYSGSPEVAPLAGAWIEIAWISFSVTAKPSLPLRERGLKCRDTASLYDFLESLPLRERGLKFAL